MSTTYEHTAREITMRGESVMNDRVKDNCVNQKKLTGERNRIAMYLNE